MNDDELITALKDSVIGVQMNIPAEHIVSRSRGIRARRRLAGAAGALAVVVGGALAVTTLLPASHQAGLPVRAQLAGWTVTKQADGSIRVAIRELRDPAGLQRRLRSDGIPASVSGVSGNPACHGNLTPQIEAAAAHVYQWRQSGYSTVVIIHPSALPAGWGVMIEGAVRPWAYVFGVGLVRESQQCAGS